MESKLRPPEKPAEAWALYVDISPAQMRDLMRVEGVVLVNVHVPHDSDIVGTDLRIPFDRIGANLDQFPHDKDARIVVYCRSGHGTLAASALASFGYTNVQNLAGGVREWLAAGLQLEDGHAGS